MPRRSTRPSPLMSTRRSAARVSSRVRKSGTTSVRDGSRGIPPAPARCTLRRSPSSRSMSRRPSPLMSTSAGAWMRKLSSTRLCVEPVPRKGCRVSPTVAERRTSRRRPSRLASAVRRAWSSGSFGALSDEPWKVARARHGSSSPSEVPSGRGPKIRKPPRWGSRSRSEPSSASRT